MEKSEYSFGAYRYFIVPNDQISLFDAIEEKRKKGLLLITVFFALGFLLVHFFFTNSDALLLDNEFLITFVGVVLGISATIVTFIFSSTEKIQ